MRVAHVIDYFQPQLGYQETYLALEQQRLGHQVVVFTSDRYRAILFRGNPLLQVEGTRIRGTGEFEEKGIVVRRFSVLAEGAGRVWMRGLITSLREFSPDAIHVHGVTTLTAIRIALAHLRHPELRQSVLVIDDHMYEAVSLRKLRWFYPLFRGFFMPWIRRSADHLVAVSEDTKKFMIEHYGLSPSEVQVIRLGVDEKRFRPNRAARKSIRSTLGLPDEAVVIIYTGKVIPRKQVDVLLQAIGLLAKDFPMLRLLVVGYAEPDYLSRLKALALKLGIADRIIWHEAVSQFDLPAYFVTADIAVWPAEHSISFLEAMSCGLPLIVGNAPKSSEEVQYNNGLMFSMGDPKDLAEKIRKLLELPEVRISMGRASRVAIERYYSWHDIAVQFLKLYHFRYQ